jgi:hypothetical protein
MAEIETLEDRAKREQERKDGLKAEPDSKTMFVLEQVVDALQR